MNIAIIRLSSLGDLVFSAPVAGWLKSLYPNSKISWFVDADFKEVIEDNPYIDEIVCINLRKIKKTKSLAALFDEINNIRKYPKFDYIIDLQGLLKSALIAKALRGEKIGFDAKSARESIASLFYNKTVSADYALNVLKRYELLIKGAFGEFKISDEPALFAGEISTKTVGAVLINVGASRANKRYPYFAEVIKELSKEVFLIWGSAEEFEIAKNLESKTTAIVLPKMNIRELKSAIASSALLIGGDSGVTHLAWGLKKPSITLFGATPAQRNCVQTTINIALDAGQNIDAKKLNYDDFAIAKVNPQTIIDAAKRLL